MIYRGQANRVGRSAAVLFADCARLRVGRVQEECARGRAKGAAPVESAKPSAPVNSSDSSETSPKAAPPPATSPKSPSETPTLGVRPSGPIEFTDITAQAGIHFKHNTGAFGKKLSAGDDGERSLLHRL